MNKRDDKDIKFVLNLRKGIIQLIVAIIGVFIILFGITMFNRYLLMQFPIGVRMLLLILIQWSLMLVPGILIKINQEKFSDYWIITENIPKQIMIGVILALFMALFLTIAPILFGFKEMVGSTSYSQPWQFAYEFIYMIIGVALAEEFVFRGFIFYKLLEIKDSLRFAMIVSSMLFGLSHVFHGDVIQVIMTAMMGLLFCIFREKIKNCTLLSLVIAHGLHNGMITLLVTIL